jgi:hypothetical protein
MMLNQTIVLCSTSNVFRHNSKKILLDHDFRVDPRGIGIEYYSNGPEFFAGNNPAKNSLETLPSGFEGTDDAGISMTPNTSPTLGISVINGSSILIGTKTCTMGGLIAIDNELFGLTVAHAFENESIDSRRQLHSSSSGSNFNAFIRSPSAISEPHNPTNWGWPDRFTVPEKVHLEWSLTKSKRSGLGSLYR